MKKTTTLQYILILLVMFVSGIEGVFAQCPTITVTHQSFCDVESPTIASLVATDNGNGVVWYSSATSTTPLPLNTFLASGATYYADDNSGLCGARPSVFVTIYNPPTGPSFQTPCVENILDATIGSHLALIGNNVQWYSVPEGGTPLPLTTQITDNTIYYASQTNPNTGCETSRKAVYVNEVVIIAPPEGDPIQYFCNEPGNAPTLADIVVIAPGVKWYPNSTSVLQLPLSTPLVNGVTYYAASVTEPCTSTTRLGVTVEFVDMNDAGNSYIKNLCDTTFPPSGTLNLFDDLGGTASISGVWTGDVATTNGHLGTLDLTMLDSDVVYTFTYTVSDSAVCPEATATVIVIMTNTYDPGLSNSLILCPEDTQPVDLFMYLGGNPDVGGFWIPALASGTGIFDPALDAFGVYTYTFNNGCSLDATITVIEGVNQNPGEDGFTPPICPSSTTDVNLFDYLGGTPDAGGVWVPALSSGTGIFNASLDAFGVYTYTFNDGCSDTATVTVVMEDTPDPGLSNTFIVCPEDTQPVDLFMYLGGNPDVGGFWIPALASGTGIFDPALDAFGVYTYTFNNGCSLDATITVIEGVNQNPGEDGFTPPICPSSTTDVNLFDYLEGTPDAGGFWVPALSSGTGIFNASLDAFGVYTYTFNDGCSDTATVTVVMEDTPDPGLSNTFIVCPEDTQPVDLFMYLGGNPDVGGFWIPALASGTGIFDPALDAFGVYTYTFNNGCSLDATITVIEGVNQNPGEDGFTPPICPNSTTDVNLFDYLGGTPDAGGVWVPALSSGTGIFNASLDAFGVYTYTFNDGCSDTATVTVVMEDTPDPGLSNTFIVCPEDTQPVDLFMYLGGNPDVGGFWIPALASGTGIFDPALDAFGVYTYTFNNGCSLDATITIIEGVNQNPGEDGFTPPICPNSTDDINLFDYLGGTPDAGGVWVPALSSGTGIFNASVDAFGVYTYTFNDGCSDTATITVIEQVVLDPGEDNVTPPICPNSTDDINLFDYLGGSPDAGGVWAPALVSGAGIFNPALDAFGVYTYSFNDGCSTETATVTIVEQVVQNPGEDGDTPPICSTSTDDINLFDYLGGTPDAGGVWVPALSSGTGIFNASVDAFGVYTYTFNDGCSDTATVTVIEQVVLHPGEDGFTPPICSNSTDDINLFDYLEGTPDVGGIWTPSLVSGTGIFNPALDAFGVYTYSFNDGCSTGTATVTVVDQVVHNSGEDGFTPPICPNSTDDINLFDYLGGTPDIGGFWVPALSSGTGIFNASVDAFGVYTYTFNDGCSDTATVTVVMEDTPDPGLSNSFIVCPGDTQPIDLFMYLGGNPDVGGFWIPALASGTGIFDPAVDAFGVYTYTFNNGCSLDATITVIEGVNQNPGEDGFTPPICPDSTEDINLFDYLGGIPDAGGVWVPALASGTGIFNASVDAFGVYTYTFNDACSDTATVTVVEDICIEDLVIPDGFSPNQDGINDYFEILNIRTLYPNYKIEIYNRYGNILFSGNASKPDWDGTTSKKMFGDGTVPVGVYFFIIEFNDGQRKPLQGRLYLSR